MITEVLYFADRPTYEGNTAYPTPGGRFCASRPSHRHCADTLTGAVDAVWPDGEVLLKDPDGDLLGCRTGGVWFGRKNGGGPLAGLCLVRGRWYLGSPHGRPHDTALEAARAWVDGEPGFTKHDQDKPRADLLPPKALLAMARVLAYGAQKYDDENWRKGGKASVPRYVAACLRHVFAYMSGELVDAETGESHLAHAMTCLGFVIELETGESDGIA